MLTGFAVRPFAHSCLQLNGVPNDIINNINPISLIVSPIAKCRCALAHVIAISDLHSHLRSPAIPCTPAVQHSVHPYSKNHGWFLLRYVGHDLVRLMLQIFSIARYLSCFLPIRATITQLYIYRMSPCGYYANTCEADGMVGL